MTNNVFGKYVFHETADMSIFAAYDNTIVAGKSYKKGELITFFDTMKTVSITGENQEKKAVGGIGAQTLATFYYGKTFKVEFEDATTSNGMLEMIAGGKSIISGTPDYMLFSRNLTFVNLDANLTDAVTTGSGVTDILTAGAYYIAALPVAHYRAKGNKISKARYVRGVAYNEKDTAVEIPLKDNGTTGHEEAVEFKNIDPTKREVIAENYKKLTSLSEAGGSGCFNQELYQALQNAEQIMVIPVADIPSTSNGTDIPQANAGQLVFPGLTQFKSYMGVTYGKDSNGLPLVHYGYAENIKVHYSAIVGTSGFKATAHDFGGTFKVIMSTLARDLETQQEVAVQIEIEKATIAAALNLQMQSEGDPATFSGTLDALANNDPSIPLLKIKRESV